MGKIASKKKKSRTVTLKFNFRILAIIGLFLVAIILGSSVIVLSKSSSKEDPKSSADIVLPSYFPEVSDFNSKNFNGQDVTNYFTGLAKSKGAVYAFAVLKLVAMPPGVDVHLLGHSIGDILYKQQGANGIKYCTQDFRNACSHSIVINLFYAKGEKAIADISKACHDAPGGPGAYTMCFHGLGHGVLAFVGYDFPKMVALCEKTATEQYNRQEFSQCVGGAVMEIISGGGHDETTWAKQRPKYLNPSDPLSLCSQSFMPAETNNMCYTYITPYLFEAAGQVNGFPTPDVIEKAFTYCEAMPQGTDQEKFNRMRCFGGFGKEFTGMALGRDIRDVGSMTDEELTNVKDWCNLANDADGTTSCIGDALQSLFWGGENKPDASFNFCAMLDNPYKASCYQDLVGAIQQYTVNPQKRAGLCQRIPTEFGSTCN